MVFARCVAVMIEAEQEIFHAGDIWEGVYSEDCFFGDPTVSFTGTFMASMLFPVYPEPCHATVQYSLSFLIKYPCAVQGCRSGVGTYSCWFLF